MISVEFGLLVWSTGLAPNPLIQGIQEVEKHEKTKRQAPFIKYSFKT